HRAQKSTRTNLPCPIVALQNSESASRRFGISASMVIVSRCSDLRGFERISHPLRILALFGRVEPHRDVELVAEVKNAAGEDQLDDLLFRELRLKLLVERFRDVVWIARHVLGELDAEILAP